MKQAGLFTYKKSWPTLRSGFAGQGKQGFHIKMDGTIEYLSVKKSRMKSAPRKIIEFFQVFFFAPLP